MLEKNMATSVKLQGMDEHMPNILQTIYMEDRKREKENSENVQSLVKEFEERQYDAKYFALLDNGKKKGGK